ncbi:hypothetical protein L1987_34031 [Smallanthus sonchifolius]|uniref:Uncharacterized protein n=1 Tax=Smallanthus sonchifolius TaxID=185202 RepID=A0ACB9HT34_9ASTR|nr:hypothetical protein L1987_34031 [Smallanthus sonchifolius]
MVIDPVLRTHKPLSVELAPGILGNIFDETSENCCKKVKEILNRWRSICRKSNIRVIYEATTTVFENSIVENHIALPPDAIGKITYIAPPGQYSLKDTVLELEFQDLACTYTSACRIKACC